MCPRCLLPEHEVCMVVNGPEWCNENRAWGDLLHRGKEPERAIIHDPD